MGEKLLLSQWLTTAMNFLIYTMSELCSCEVMFQLLVHLCIARMPPIIEFKKFWLVGNNQKNQFETVISYKPCSILFWLLSQELKKINVGMKREALLHGFHAHLRNQVYVLFCFFICFAFCIPHIHTHTQTPRNRLKYRGQTGSCQRIGGWRDE